MKIARGFRHWLTSCAHRALMKMLVMSSLHVSRSVFFHVFLFVLLLGPSASSASTCVGVLAKQREQIKS